MEEKRRAFIFFFLIAILITGTIFAAWQPKQSFASPPVPNASLWITNGSVNATAIDSTTNTLYLGGNFTQVGPYEGNAVPLDTSTAAITGAYPQVNGPVYASIPDGSGGWYIGGFFSYVGGINRNELAHITSTGSVDINFNPDLRQGYVTCLLLNAGVLYVGGTFSSVNGTVTRNGIAAFNTSDGSVTTWYPTLANAGQIWTLFLLGNTMFIGDGGAEAFSITGTGASANWNPHFNGPVKAFAFLNNILYVGGQYSALNSGLSTRNGLAAFDFTSGFSATPLFGWDPSLGQFGVAQAMAIHNGNIYVVGRFTTVNNVVTRNNAAEFNTSGQAQPWNPNISANFNGLPALQFNGSNVFIGGDFNTVAGNVAQSELAEFTDSTGALISWNANITAMVRTLSLNGTTLYTGGDFNFVHGTIRNSAAAFNLSTGAATSWDAQLSGGSFGTTVDALLVHGGNIYVAGDFTTSGASTRNDAAEFNTVGTLQNWNPNIGGTSPIAQSLASIGTNIYIGGSFNTIGGTTRRDIGEVDDAAGALNTGWDPSADGSVLALTTNGSLLYLGGNFVHIHTIARTNVAQLDTTSVTPDTPTTWNPNLSGNNGTNVDAINILGSSIYLGGSFGAAAYDTSATQLSFNPNFGTYPCGDGVCNGTVSAIVSNSCYIYLAGVFLTAGGSTRDYVGEFDKTTGSVTSWTGDLGSYLGSISGNALALDNSGNLLIGGSFTNEGPLPTGGSLNQYGQSNIVQDPIDTTCTTTTATPTATATATPTATATITPTSTTTVTTTTTATPTTTLTSTATPTYTIIATPTPTATTTPTSPTDSITTPGIPKTQSPTSNQRPTWTWTASQSSVGSSITYVFQWCQNSDFANCSANRGTSTSTSFTQPIPLAFGVWYAEVYATDANHAYSALSPVAIVVITPPTYSPTPTPTHTVTPTPTVTTTPSPSTTAAPIATTPPPTPTPTPIIQTTTNNTVVVNRAHGFVNQNPAVTQTTLFGGVILIGFADVGTAYTGIASAGLIIGQLLNALLALLLDIPLQLLQLLNILLQLLGVRKKPRPWGVLYDSVSKQPIDPALITLYKKMPEGTVKEIETRTPDFQGRFGFLVEPGTYVIKVTRQNYVFPSNRLAGATNDGEYSDLYFGGDLVVKDPDLIAVNIPLDPFNYDWNQTQKPVFYKKHHFNLNALKNFVFTIGIILSALIYIISPTTLNLIIFLLYPVSFIIGHLVAKRKKWGVVYYEDSHETLPLANVEAVKDVTGHEVREGTSVTDNLGRYYMILNEGDHYLKVEKETDTGPHMLAETSVISVTKDNTVMNPDIPVKGEPSV